MTLKNFDTLLDFNKKINTYILQIHFILFLSVIGSRVLDVLGRKVLLPETCGAILKTNFDFMCKEVCKILFTGTDINYNAPITRTSQHTCIISLTL